MLRAEDFLISFVVAKAQADASFLCISLKFTICPILQFPALAVKSPANRSAEYAHKASGIESGTCSETTADIAQVRLIPMYPVERLACL
jgi:hypothetical protein